MTNPQVLLLDEPTTGLDMAHRRTLRTLVRETAQRTEAAVLVSSHLVDDLLSMSDRLVVIHAGRLTYQGSKAEFLALADRMGMGDDLEGALISLTESGVST